MLAACRKRGARHTRWLALASGDGRGLSHPLLVAFFAKNVKQRVERKELKRLPGPFLRGANGDHRMLADTNANPYDLLDPDEPRRALWTPTTRKSTNVPVRTVNSCVELPPSVAAASSSSSAAAYSLTVVL